MFYAPSGTGPTLKQKKDGTYQASNVWFSPERMEATSFNWWYFVKRFASRFRSKKNAVTKRTLRDLRKAG